MADDTTNLSVTTDASDYEPGVTAQFTVDGLSAGDAVTFTVAHVDAGADGILGTADDVVLDDITGTGTPWTITDGGPGDLDGVVNGVVTTSWYVNQDALGQSFVLTATDLNTGASATTSFTDNTHTPVPADPVNITNGLVFLTGDQNTSTGTGIFPSFVTIQNTGTEEGFNTSNPPVEDTGSSPAHNHSLLFSEVPTVTGDGTNGTVAGEIYREFRLDLNEQSNAITLDKLIVYSGTDGSHTTLTGLTELYNMDGGADGLSATTGDNVDASAGLTAWSSGSGHSDYKILIPDSFFNGVQGTDFIYLYSQFSGADSGFEEWSVGPTTPVGAASISVEKDTVDTNGSTVISSDGITVLKDDPISWTYAITNTGSVGVTLTSIIDDSGTPGNALDDVNLIGMAHTGDDNNNNILDPGETWTYTLPGTAIAGNYTNNVVVNGTTVSNGTVTNQDFSSYFGADPELAIDKKTNGVDTGLHLLAGQAVTWTYDVTLGAGGNVSVLLDKTTGVVDDQGVTVTYMGGDANSDGKVDLGETWHFQATGVAIAGSYTNTGTVTGSFFDDAGHEADPSAHDSSDYLGIGQSLPGLTKGYWSTHLTLWDVAVGDEKGSGSELNVAPQYNWNHTGGITQSTLTTTGSSSSLGLVKTANNGGGDTGLLLGDLDHNGLATDTQDLFFDLASAQLIANTSTSGDARLILASQAIAAQLNEYNDYVYDQAHGGILSGFTASPQGLIEEAVQWLKGDTSFALSANGHSNVNFSTSNDLASPSVVAIIDNGTAATNDYKISGSSLTFSSASMSSSDASWSKLVSTSFTYTSDVDHASHTVYADGEGLKNALAAYNHGLDGSTAGFVMSTDGSLIGWQDSLGGLVYDVHANTTNAFWGILEDQNLLGHTIAGISDHL